MKTQNLVCWKIRRQNTWDRNVPHHKTPKILYGVRSGQFAGQSGSGTPQALNQVPSPPGKWNQYLHKAGQQKEAWSALKSPGRWLCSPLTWKLAEHQHQQMMMMIPNHHWLWKRTGAQTAWNLCISTLSPDNGSLISKYNSKCTVIWEEDFGPLSNSSVIVLSCSPLLKNLPHILEKALFDNPAEQPASLTMTFCVFGSADQFI